VAWCLVWLRVPQPRVDQLCKTGAVRAACAACDVSAAMMTASPSDGLTRPSQVPSQQSWM
jgi:hypothetical protein